MIAGTRSARKKLCGVALLWFFCQAAVAEENWPQWRGPAGNGVAAEGQYPVKFSGEEGVAWKVDLPGRGSSTPAVWGDAIFVTCAIDGQDGVVSYDMNGQERWRRQLGAERAGKHPNGSGSNPSPVTDGKHVVVYFKSGTLACFDVDGRELWRVNLQEKFGKDTLWWDLGTSPVLAGERTIVAVMQADESYLVAFNLADGNVLWKQPRKYDCTVESDQAYTTPEVVRVGERELVVSWGADHLTAHDAATGELVWECGGFNLEDQKNWRAIASSVIGDGFAVVPFGRGEFVASVRLDGRGDVTQSHRAWLREGIGADVPTPAIKGQRVYLLSDKRQLTCLDLQTGKDIWTAELPRNRNKFYASPVLGGDKIYCTREDGIVFVGSAEGEQFEQLAQNDMGERVIATPIPLRGGLLIRGEQHLFRIASPAAIKAATGG